jgi:hypothetical protein
MTGQEMMQIRKSMQLGRRAFARHLGYAGSSENNFKTIMRYEMGIREVPIATARTARALKEVFDLTGKLPEENAVLLATH